ncbi:MAG: ABC transporter permease [Chloroflexi bacterium]|nr:ABC transporter permease [Chloroflexota bacterium]
MKSTSNSTQRPKSGVSKAFRSVLAPIASIGYALGGASMLKFLFRRLLAAIPVLFAIMVFTFGMSHSLPGGPFDAVNQRPMPQHVREQLNQRYGLHKALFFDTPTDGKGADTAWGETTYVKGGFGTTDEGSYEALEDTGFAFRREYTLHRWDEAKQEYVEYVQYPYRDWSANTGQAVQTANSVTALLASLSGVPTAGGAFTNYTSDYTSIHYQSEYLNGYEENCRRYFQMPGWSLLAKRHNCVTTGGTVNAIFNEEQVSWTSDPLDSQFWNYIWGVLNLDFGPSLNIAQLQENTQVIDEIRNRLPVSMQIGLYSVIFGFTMGIPLGVLAAIYHNSAIDYSASFSAILLQSVPSIVLAPIMIIIFAVELKWLPTPSPLVWRTQFMSADYIKGVILPMVALGTGMSAGIARLTRASLLQVLGEDYIRTARAKGLRERAVIYIHALKNSLIPVATILGPLLAGVLTGTFVIERIFVIPGLGESFVDSVSARDYTTIMALTTLYSVFLIFGNIMVDIIYTWLDPRIRFD